MIFDQSRKKRLVGRWGRGGWSCWLRLGPFGLLFGHVRDGGLDQITNRLFFCVGWSLIFVQVVIKLLLGIDMGGGLGWVGRGRNVFEKIRRQIVFSKLILGRLNQSLNQILDPDVKRPVVDRQKSQGGPDGDDY